MNSKVLAIQSKLVVPENWAKWWQVSGRPRLADTNPRRWNRDSYEGFKAHLKFLALICLFFMVPSAVFARTDQASWENLSAIGAGHKIEVLELNSKKVSGTFMNFSNTSISLQALSGSQSILRQDVRSVTLLENHHRLRNALIGGAIGAGAGAGIGAAAYRSCSPTQSFCIDPIGRGGVAGIGAVVGFAGGAIVGALWPSHKTVYRSTDQ
jgi:hypothetical protein